jgi:two-component system response regulator AlgR
MSTPLRILIVDDEAPARERLRELLADGAAELPVEVTAEAASGVEALALFPGCHADIALIDIHMPAMSGIELARHLQALEHPPAVVFITAHDQYAVQAFEVNALDYLLKPVRLARLLVALRKAAGNGRVERGRLARADPGPRRYFSAVERGRVTLIPVEEVLYLRAEQKYVTAKTREREFLIEDSLNQLEQELEALFIRVHRNCLVGRRYIRGAQRAPEADEGGEPRWAVVLDGCDDPIAVSRRQWPAVKAVVRH